MTRKPAPRRFAELPAEPRRGARRVALVYAAVAAIWILVSDRLLAALPLPFVLAASIKGLVFVVATAWMLYVLVRRHAAALARSEAQLRSTLEGIADGVLVAEPGGRIVEANASALRLLGIDSLADSPRDLQALRQILRPPSGEPAPDGDDPLTAALQGETVMRLAEVVVPGEPTRHLHIGGSPIWEGRRVVRAVAVLRDVSQVHRLERLREEFLATAAHELKTPVAAIKGYVQLLLRWAPEGHDPREKKAFQVIDRQCSRVGRLVGELLEAAQMQHGRLELNLERTDLSRQVGGIVERLAPMLARRKVKLDLAPGIEILGDPPRLEAILANLLDNAVRFSADGSTIQLRTLAYDGQAEVTVSDAGIGIPSSRRAEIFEPALRDRWLHEAGIGIGLHVSREIARLHGGELWFETEVGRGSTFHLRLPLPPPARLEEGPALEEAPPPV